MLTLLFIILGVVVGVIIGGCVVRSTIVKNMYVGTLRVDTSDPADGPYLFLELSKNVDAVMSKKRVVLDVSIENFISQK